MNKQKMNSLSGVRGVYVSPKVEIHKLQIKQNILVEPSAGIDGGASDVDGDGIF